MARSHSHSHYVMGLYYDNGNPDALRRDVLRITAADDTEAINEASRISSWRQPVRYDVRAITKAARASHRLVYASVVAEPALEDVVHLEAGSPSAESVPDVVSPPQRDLT